MFGGCVSRDPPDIEDILKLNPKIHRYANAQPSVVTKEVGLLAQAAFVHFENPVTFCRGVGRFKQIVTISVDCGSVVKFRFEKLK